MYIYIYVHTYVHMPLVGLELFSKGGLNKPWWQGILGEADTGVFIPTRVLSDSHLLQWPQKLPLFWSHIPDAS